MALSKIQAESMNLADTYAFTGTVSGAGGVTKLFNSYRSGTQTINHDAWSQIQLNAETYDVDSKFDITTYRYTPAEVGYYYLHCNLSLNFNDSQLGRRMGVRIKKNTSTIAFTFNRLNEGSNDYDEISTSITFIDYLSNTSDYYTVEAYQNNGAGTHNCDIIGGSNYTYFMGYKLT